MNQNNSFDRIYKVVQKIPEGKVMTYGQVAQAANVATPRIVGFALHVNPSESQTPCHRVVFADGSLTPGYAFGGEDIQREKLVKEGVKFLKNGRVNLESSLFTA